MNYFPDLLKWVCVRARIGRGAKKKSVDKLYDFVLKMWTQNVTKHCLMRQLKVIHPIAAYSIQRHLPLLAALSMMNRNGYAKQINN